MILFRNSNAMMSREIASKCMFLIAKANPEHPSVKDRIVINTESGRGMLIIDFPSHDEAKKAFGKILEYLQSNDKSLSIENNLESE